MMTLDEEGGAEINHDDGAEDLPEVASPTEPDSALSQNRNSLMEGNEQNSETSQYEHHGIRNEQEMIRGSDVKETLAFTGDLVPRPLPDADKTFDAASSFSDDADSKRVHDESLTLKAWFGNRSPPEKKWSFPWKLCKSWKGMRSQIKGAFVNNSLAVAVIEEGNFELKDKGGHIVSPEAWEDLAKPFMELSITFTIPWATEPQRLIPRKPLRRRGPSGLPNEKNADLDAEVKIGYSVQMFETSSHDHRVHFFRYQKYYTHPKVIVPRSWRTRPVLQETTEIVRLMNPRNLPREEDVVVSKTDPKPEVMYPTDRIKRISLTINSPELLNALRSVVRYTSQSPASGKDSLVQGIFPAPFEDLYLHRDELRQLKYQTNETRKRHSAEYNVKCDRHIEYLLEWLSQKEKSHTGDDEGPIDGNAATITFNSFWQFLKPGSDVFIRENGKLGLYIVESVTGGVIDKRAKAYTIHVWNLRFDGQYIGRKLRALQIPPWEGARDLKTLPIFPTYVYKDKDGSSAIEEDLIERGKKYFSFTKKSMYQEFTGWTLRRNRKHDRVRVIIVTNKEVIKADAKYFLDSWETMQPTPKIQPGLHARAAACQCEICEHHYATQSNYAPVAFASYDKIRPLERDELSDHQYKLCAGTISAYILKDRIYDLLDIDDVSNPKFNARAIDKLVIKPESSKSMIKAICEAYMDVDSRIRPFSADAIRGKGEGQVILLHGPPGVGKTLTAESVAEFTRRPLLSITAADLSQDPMKLEENLLKFFANAQDWDAIVLLDEADVYLESRQLRDMWHNGMVSVFLRTIEYFQGIMFLTTNRVGSFDEAFLSRIHVQIAYEPLSQDSRIKIWKSSFRKLEEDYQEGGPEIQYEYRAEQYVCGSNDVRDLEWNGREMRNAFQTAVALARYEAQGDVPKITEGHFEQVVAMSKKFKEYMRSARHRDDSTLAYQRSLRDDAFGKEPPAQPSSGWAARTANR